MRYSSRQLGVLLGGSSSRGLAPLNHPQWFVVCDVSLQNTRSRVRISAAAKACQWGRMRQRSCTVLWVHFKVAQVVKIILEHSSYTVFRITHCEVFRCELRNVFLTPLSACRWSIFTSGNVQISWSGSRTLRVKCHTVIRLQTLLSGSVMWKKDPCLTFTHRDTASATRRLSIPPPLW